jgi:hypothetical protein
LAKISFKSWPPEASGAALAHFSQSYRTAAQALSRTLRKSRHGQKREEKRFSFLMLAARRRKRNIADETTENYYHNSRLLRGGVLWVGSSPFGRR